MQVAGIKRHQSVIQGQTGSSERAVISQKDFAAVITFQYIQISNYYSMHVFEANVTTITNFTLRKCEKKHEWIRWFQRSSEETLRGQIMNCPHLSEAGRKTRKRLTTVPRQKACLLLSHFLSQPVGEVAGLSPGHPSHPKSASPRNSKPQAFSHQASLESL